MTELQELIQEIREQNQLLREIVLKQAVPSMVKVQEAARILSISPATIRHMCASGIIKATLISKTAKNKHWIINIQQAREDLARGGYLQLIAEKHKQKAGRGRKSSTDLNHQ
jgi:hypothetical protein